MFEQAASAGQAVGGPHFGNGWSRVSPDTRADEATPGRDRAPLLLGCRRIVLLTEGHSCHKHAKTAVQMLRYRADDIVAVLDSDNAGADAESLFGVGPGIPVIEDVSDAPHADALFIGIAPAGGRLPETWRSIVRKAVESRLHVVSGLHAALAEDPELAELAEKNDVCLVDVRCEEFKRVARRPDFRPACTRVQTVGTDCSVGKMSAAMEIELGLRRRGRNAGFAATGQTGVMIRGSGITIDGVVADFINGAAEQLVLENEHYEILLLEGQGSLVHPAYSGVTLGLLHGAAPDALVLCHEAGRETVKSLHHVPIWPLDRLVSFYETVASARHPCRVIGVALNTRRLSEQEAEEELRRVEGELGLPACDVYRDGAGRLVEAVERFDAGLRQERGTSLLQGAAP